MTNKQYTTEQRANWIALIESLDSEQLAYISNTLWREMYTDLNDNPFFDDHNKRQSVKNLYYKLSNLFKS